MADWEEYKKDNDRLLKENAELKKTTEFLRSMLGKSNDKVIKLKAERDEMESENERLKLMLKQAIKDFEKTDCGAGCGVCVKGQDAKWCYNTGFEWKCAKQALKLIGGDE